MTKPTNGGGAGYLPHKQGIRWGAIRCPACAGLGVVPVAGKGKK